MKITLSKSQWEAIGSKSGWTKKAQEVVQPTSDTSTLYSEFKQNEQYNNGITSLKGVFNMAMQADPSGKVYKSLLDNAILNMKPGMMHS